MSRSELENKMAVLLGGRAAEAIVFDEISTGAADDLAKATDIARSMVTRYGMAESLGQLVYEDEPQRFLGPTPIGPDRRYSEETARKIDEAVRQLIDAAFEKAREILRDARPTLDAAAEELLRKETLRGDELVMLTRRDDRLRDKVEIAAASTRGDAGHP